VHLELTLEIIEGDHSSQEVSETVLLTTSVKGVGTVLDQSRSLWKLTYSVCPLSSQPHLYHLLPETLVMGRGSLQGYIQGKISIDFVSLDKILSVNKYGTVDIVLESYRLVFSFWLL